MRNLGLIVSLLMAVFFIGCQFDDVITASPSETIINLLNTQQATGKQPQDIGKWIVKLNPTEYRGEVAVSIKGDNTKEITNTYLVVYINSYKSENRILNVPITANKQIYIFVVPYNTTLFFHITGKWTSAACDKLEKVVPYENWVGTKSVMEIQQLGISQDIPCESCN